MTTEQDIYTVSELNAKTRLVIEETFAHIWIVGEISNLSRPSSGHLYFSLKDAHAQVRCAFFRNAQRRMNFIPENGQQVLLQAQVSLYEVRGDFQLIVTRMQLAGDGALQIAFEKLKQKLAHAGLFSDSHKQALPVYPRQIGIVTSASTAALQDILKVLKRRFAAIPIILYPSSVQGVKAAPELVAAIETANRRNDCDVLILARGGGSLEDLWAFNEEIVARAIFKSGLPIITGIGHEIDFTIADFVADQRAATPSAAAECVSPDQKEILSSLMQIKNQLLRFINTQIKHEQMKLQHLKKRLRHPGQRLREQTQRLDQLEQNLVLAMRNMLSLRNATLQQQMTRFYHESPQQHINIAHKEINNLKLRLTTSMQFKLKQWQQQVNNVSQALETLSPLNTLKRGYAIVTKKTSGEIIRRADEVVKGELINAKLSEGSIDSEVR